MIDRIRQHSLSRMTTRWTRVVQQGLSSRFVHRPAFRLAAWAIGLAIIYWGLLASNRYVSEAHVVIDRTDFSGSQSSDVASLLTGVRSGHDVLLLRDYLLSTDMLNMLEAKLNLRAHYSDWRRDPLSRMWFENTSQEWFHRYYLSRVKIEMDAFSGVLLIQAQAYTPEMAHAIAVMLVEEGERFMNEMAHRLAREQVGFLEKQVSQMSERMMQARRTMLDYQNAKGLMSPKAQAESLTMIVARLEGQIADAKAKRQVMMGYLSPDAPDVAQVNVQITALEKQLVEEQKRLASPEGKTLNKVVEEFQRLQMEAEFAQDIYRTALIALEKGRVESTRTLKKLSILQNPTLPEYALEPRRLYNITTFTLVVLMLAGIVHLLAAIIRDHKD